MTSLGYILRRWFEEDLRCRFSDGTEDETVFIGGSEFTPVEILREFQPTYDSEFRQWLDDNWKPRQQDLRDEILRYHANSDRYLDLKAAVRRQQVVPLVGSGMSVPSGLPTWANLLTQIGGFAQCDLSRLDQLILDYAFEEAADLLANTMARRLMVERVQHSLRMNDPKAINGPVYLLPDLFPNLAITTNLDNVLEHVYRACDVPFEYILSGTGLVGYREIKSSAERFLLKLHGDLQKPTEWVLSTEEYETAYAPQSTLRTELSLVYQNNRLLFLGCSLGIDRTVGLIREVSQSDASMPTHYAFLTRPDDDTDRRDKENSLAQAGIAPIWYDLPHDDAIAALLDGLYPDGV